MFSVFTENDSTRRTTIQNENNVSARKPTLSARKPLADRKSNVELESTPSVKPKVMTPRPVLKEKNIPHDIFFDFCSYKRVSDNYEDLSAPENFLGEKAVNDIIASFTRKNIPEPAPPQFAFEEPRPLELNIKMPEMETVDIDDIKVLFENDCKGLWQPPLPPFDDLL